MSDNRGRGRGDRGDRGRGRGRGESRGDLAFRPAGRGDVNRGDFRGRGSDRGRGGDRRGRGGGDFRGRGDFRGSGSRGGRGGGRGAPNFGPAIFRLAIHCSRPIKKKSNLFFIDKASLFHHLTPLSPRPKMTSPKHLL